MSIIFMMNIVFINIVVLLLLSVFLSKWTYKLFKPYAWQEDRRKKHILPAVEKIEARFKDRNRFYAVWFLMRQIDDNDVAGDMACVGVDGYELASVMHHLSPQRKLLLFDKFDKKPLHGVRENCDGQVREEVLETKNLTKEEVIRSIEGNSNVIAYAGDVKQNVSENGVDTTYSLVSFDIIYYDLLSDMLAVFYARLSPGGVMLVHDYNHNWDDVRRAVNDFAATVPESFVAIPDMYGSVVLVKTKR